MQDGSGSIMRMVHIQFNDCIAGVEPNRNDMHIFR